MDPTFSQGWLKHLEDWQAKKRDDNPYLLDASGQCNELRPFGSSLTVYYSDFPTEDQVTHELSTVELNEAREGRRTQHSISATGYIKMALKLRDTQCVTPACGNTVANNFL